MDGLDRSCCLEEAGTIHLEDDGVLGMCMNTLLYPRLVRSTVLCEGVGRRKEQGEGGAGEPGRTAAAQAAMEDMVDEKAAHGWAFEWLGTIG